MSNYGYIRVSTREQNEERQIVALHQFGITEHQIYIDKQRCMGKIATSVASTQLLATEICSQN